MRNSKQRALSFLLSIVMLLSGIMPAFADDFSNEPSKNVLSSRELSSLERELSNFDVNDSKASSLSTNSGKLRVVVELNKDPIASIARSNGKTVKDFTNSQINAYEKRILDQQDDVKKKLLSADIKTYDTGDDNKKSDYSYTTVINGFSTYIDSKDLEKLENLKEVKNVYIVNEYNRPADLPNMDSSGLQVGADTTWNLGYKGEGMVVAVLDSGFDINHKDFKITDSNKTALKQSDIDFLSKINNLPGKYYTDKFPYAYNYYDKTDKIKSETSNHGQHVAGTIGANGKIKGIAPEAQLLGMKVFSDDPLYSTTFSDVYVKAIDDSVKLRADSINMSLGSPAGNYIYGALEDVAIRKARDAGVQVALAAGNEHSIIDGIDGYKDLLTTGIPYPLAKNVDTAVVGSPSLYQGDISVASVNNTHLKGRYIAYKTSSKEGQIQMSPAAGSPNPWDILTDTYKGSDILLMDKDNKGDKSKAPGDEASFEGKDVKDKILLIERGNTFTDTIANAQSRGAKAVIIYNNERPDDNLLNMAGGDTAKIPFMQIVRSDGLKIIENLDNISLSFPDQLKSFDHPKAGLISDFSSIGPTPELGIKPEISAPGGDIYSTDNDDSYVNMSGTSMATPHVAGALALVGQRINADKETFGNISKEERGKLAKILLLNTSKPIKNSDGQYYAVRQQGSGLMDINGATSTDTYVIEKSSGEAKAEVGSFKDSKITINLTIFNKSKENRRFNIHANALTDATEEIDGYKYLLETTKNIEGIKVSGGGDVIVPKLGKKEVRITIDLSEAIASGELSEQNFVEGFVFLDSKDKKVDLSLPYLGFYGNYEELNVLDEPITNLYDNDKSNDPMFTSTHLYYQEDGKLTYPATSHTPVYINPKVKGYGNSGLILRTTPLRNFDRIEFAIEDKYGNVLENLGQTSGGRKITNMATGQAPYRFFDEGLWDGTISGKPLDTNKSVYYVARAFYMPNSKPQIIKFEVSVDDSFPVVKDINGEFKSIRNIEDSNDPYYKVIKGADARLAYDKESRQITFEAYDTISGVDSVILSNPATLKSDKAQLKIWQGSDKLDTIRELVDKEKGIYKYSITLPEEGYENNIVNVEIIDKANNFVKGAVIRDEIEERNTQTDQASIYSFNENTRILRLNVKPGANVFLIPIVGGKENPSPDFNNMESFEDDDNDGIIDAKLAKKYKANEVFSIISAGTQIKYVLPVAEDKSKPLAPIIDPITSEKTTKEIKGFAYEADMTIKAYQNGKVIGKSKSDDDGLFTIKLDSEVKDSYDITVTASRDIVNLTSDSMKLVLADIKAPEVEKDSLLIEQTEIKGDAFAPFVDVVFEKDGKDGKREEFARVKSQANGRFALYDVNFSENGLKVHDKVYIYSIKDDQKSEDTVLSIKEGEGLDQPSDKLTMFINSPELLEGYNSKVPFDITMFGWDNLDKLTFNGIDLPFTVNEYQKVIHPKTKEQVHYGKTFNAKTSLDLAEGYYDIPIIAYDEKNEQKFGLTRRFWVDKTKPEISVVTSEMSEEDIDDKGNKVVTVKTTNNEVNLNFVIKDNGPEVILYKGDTQLYTNSVTDASGFALKETKASVNDIVKLGHENEVTYDYTASDIAGNKTTITVKVQKEENNENSEKAPIITASDRTAYVGEKVNLLYQVSAKDKDANDLKEKVTSDPKSIDTSKPGEYKVKYSVIDKDGNYGEKIVTVKVIARKDNIIDTSNLQAKIKEAKKYESDDYSKASYQKLIDVIKKAEYEEKSVSLTDDIVNSLIDELDDAISKLVDISELKKAYDIAKDEISVGKDDYTLDSYNDLVSASEKVGQILRKENPSQAEVDLGLRNLNEALKNLERKADKKDLIKLYNSLSKSLANGEISLDKYTDESMDALMIAIENAKTLIENEDASQKEVDKAYENLLEVHKNLVEKEAISIANKEKLTLLYKAANSIKKDDLTPSSAKALEDALQNAYEVLDNQNASQKEVDKAYEKLEKVLNDKKIKANKESIITLIEKYADIDKDQYTEDSYKVFEEILAKAKEIIRDEEISQQEVDELSKDLVDAFDKLEKNPNNLRKELEALIEVGKNELKKSSYSRQSKMTLKLKVQSSKRALSKVDVSDEELSQKIEDLKLALKNLK